MTNGGLETDSTFGMTVQPRYKVRKQTMRNIRNFIITAITLVFFYSIQTFAEISDVRLRIHDKPSDKKTITIANLIKIKQFILKKGHRDTYCNMYNNNPAYRTKSFCFYLNPDSGQDNINCDINKSDFNTLVIQKPDCDNNQYRMVEFLDPNWVYIIVSSPTEDLTVSQIHVFVSEAMMEILKIIDIEMSDKSDAGDGK